MDRRRATGIALGILVSSALVQFGHAPEKLPYVVLLGLFAIAVLQNGLHLAALPSELTGVLTGVLLVSTIALDHHGRRSRAPAR